METLTFAGIEGTIKHVSEHGNYVTLQFSNRVTIIGTFSNDYHWDIMPDIHSGFIAFITYIGLNSEHELTGINSFISEHDGYFKAGEVVARKAKWVNSKYELKVRGFHPQSVVDLVNYFDNQQ